MGYILLLDAFWVKFITFRNSAVVTPMDANSQTVIDAMLGLNFLYISNYKKQNENDR